LFVVAFWALPVATSLSRFKKVWFGLVWFGLVWFGLAWLGLAWLGLVETEHERKWL